MSAKDDRPEFCQQIQTDFAEFERAHYGRMGVKQYRPRFYPPENVEPFDHETATGWRVTVYTMDGHVERIFPFTVRVARVVGGPLGGTAEFRVSDDPGRYWPLLAKFDADCAHDCRPIPHPACGCGIYATSTPADAGTIIRCALANGRPLSSWAQVIAYQVELTGGVYVRGPVTDPRVLAPLKEEGLPGWAECVGASARIVGPILTTSTSAADDLQARGFDAQHVADSPEELAEHLEALAVTT